MEKGVIMSAFFFGYSFAFAGGFMINKFGGVTVFGVTLALTAILTALSPFFLHIHLHIFIIGRALQGLFGVRLLEFHYTIILQPILVNIT